LAVTKTMNTYLDEHKQSEPVALEESTPKRKKWWTRTKAILGHVLPFLILVSLPLTIVLISLNADPIESVPDERWEDLEENWEQYVKRGEELGYASVDTDLFELAPCTFGFDSSSWDEGITPEKAGFVCGYVTVPLYHDQPDGETIGVAVAIWPTYDEPHFPDPLFITQGGPGSSTLKMYPEYIYPNRSGGERDLVFVEQRGTYYSEPNLICSYTNWLEGLPKGEDPDDYEYSDFLSICREDLLFEGIDLNAFTTPQIARDFEVVRQALGYEKINFYGVSYGTLVGQYLAAYHPESLRSLVLDGVVTLPFDYKNHSLERFDRVLNELAESCQQDPACAQAYPDLLDRLDQLIEEMEAAPKKVKIKYPDDLFPSGDTLDGESFYYFFLHMFYYDQSFAFLPYIMEQAEKDNFDLFEVMTEWMLEFNLVQPGVYYSVVCSEHEYFSEIPEGESRLVPAGIDWEGNSRQELRDECALWDVQRSPDTLDEMPVSEIPALLMSGQFDPVTPPENGEEVLSSFSNGQHLVDPVGGHGVTFSDTCTKSILKDFLNGLDQPVDNECLTDEDRRSQAVPPSAVSSPFMYKIMASDIAYPMMVLVPILVLVLMILRFAGNYFYYLWRNLRGKVKVLDEPEKRLRLRYELASWTVAVTSVGLAIGFSVYFYRAYEVPSFLYALAMPGGVRMVLINSWLLFLILPLTLYFGVRMYLRFPSILKRVRYIFQALYCLSIAVFLAWSGLLWASVR
jgi:pimeloyl-ACP methyl ester carboxylesterase